MEHDFVINDRIFVRSFVKGKNIRLLMFSIRFTTTFLHYMIKFVMLVLRHIENERID